MAITVPDVANIADGGHTTDHNTMRTALLALDTKDTNLGVYNVKDYGAVGDGVANDTAAIQATIAAAEGAGYFNIVWFPLGTYKIVGTLSLSGKSVQLRGTGGGYRAGAYRGSVLQGSAQTGPVLNFTGWLSPDSFRGRVEHSGLVIVGDGVANTANIGILTNGLTNCAFRNITIANTGGIGLSMVSSYLNTFTDIMIMTPISAKANNVPYLKMLGPSNGNVFTNVGLRSIVASADTGAGGAWVVVDDGSFPPSGNVFYSCWAEFLHPPTNGTIYHFAGNQNTLSDCTFWDCSKEAAATGTSMIRFVPSSVTDYGGNTVRGIIPSSESVDFGVDIQQSGNSLTGVKAYNGGNAIIASGVTRTSVVLYGSISGAVGTAVTDNSGQTTNTVIDPTGDYEKSRNYTLSNNATYGALQIKNPADLQKGAIVLGKGSVIFDNGAAGHLYIQAQSNSLGTFFRHDFDRTSAQLFAMTGNPNLILSAFDAGQPDIQSTNGWWRKGTSGQVIRMGAGTPESVITAPVGSLFLRSDGGAGTCLYIKETGAGNTGWVGK